MRTVIVCCLVLSVVLCAGCISTAPTTVEKEGGVYKVVANSLLLHNHIRVVERSTRETNGLLEAQIRGQNITSKDVQFEYRFLWLDADGIKIDTQMSTWKPLSLHAKEIAYMKGVAPTPEATDFMMALRFPQQSKRW